MVVELIKKVWGTQPRTLLQHKSLLVSDSLRGHLVEVVKENMNPMKSDSAIIPRGLTSILQPLDIGINKPFKNIGMENHT